MAVRLIVAAVLALVVHAGLLAAKIPWFSPKMLATQSREVSINLVHIEKPTPAPDPEITSPEPKPTPKPVRRPKPKPKAKPIVKPKEPEPPPLPVPSPAKAELPPPEPETAPPTEDDSISVETVESAAVSPPPAEDPGAVVELSVPLYALNPPPNYPKVAQRRRYEGTVVLDVLVDTAGNAAEVKVAQSSGYKVLDRSALADVRRWRFKPARKGPRTVEMWVQVPVRFELKK